MEAYAAAYSAWKSVRVRLEHTIQDYHDACAVLRDALSVPPPSVSCREFREQRLMELDHARQSFLSHTQRLQRAQSYLSLVRNISYTLSPIALLPHDILYTILAVIVRPGAKKHGPRAMRTPAALITTLSSVCNIWRRVMLRSSGFWTAPELVLQGTASQPNYQLARLWAERSRDAVVDLFISECRNRLRRTFVPHDWSTTAVENLIVSLMPRVRTMNIGASFRFTRTSLRSMVNCWATHGTMGRAERLDVWDDGNWDSEPGLAVIVPSTYADIGAGAFADFFSSVRSLSIHDTWRNVEEIAHAGLVELRIETPIDWFPTLWDIGAVLTAVPRLRLLVLVNIDIVRAADEPHVVALDHLETLVLYHAALWQVLGILATSNNIQVGISVEDDPRCISAVQSFFTRTQISRLHMIAYDISHTGSVSAAFVPMPYLQELALDYFTLPVELLQAVMEGPSANIWPALREIQLLDCDASPQALDRLVAIHPPQTLLWYCELESSISTAAHAEVEEMLSEHGVKVVWVTEKGDLPVYSWECSA